MELVAAKRVPAAPSGQSARAGSRRDSRGAAALGEARRDGRAGQPWRGRTPSASISLSPEHHVAAALAVHRAARGEWREPSRKRAARGERGRHAARDSRRAASRHRNPSGGASSASGEKVTISAPAARQPLEHMRIDEGEGRVGASAMRWPGGGSAATGALVDPSRESGDAMRSTRSRSNALGELGEAIAGEARGRRVSPRLHQPEMALGERWIGFRAGCAPSTGMPSVADGRPRPRRDGGRWRRWLRMTPAMRDARIEAGAAERRPPRPIAPGRTRRARAAPASRSARRCRRSAPSPPGLRLDAVEQAHGAFDDQRDRRRPRPRRRCRRGALAAIAQLSRLRHGAPVAAAWKAGSI